MSKDFIKNWYLKIWPLPNEIETSVIDFTDLTAGQIDNWGYKVTLLTRLVHQFLLL